ncbi:hypothetical protein, partial [Pseudomonas putida]|uniref:hypothetical protein n=1 Tax=Pseudomonas putida TaxID=303 RepID=UPI001CB9B528
PVEWPDGRGISGRMRVEWVAGSAWNRWSDAHGMGGQMTVESAFRTIVEETWSSDEPWPTISSPAASGRD